MSKKQIATYIYHMKQKHIAFMWLDSGEFLTIDDLLTKFYGREIELGDALNFIQ